LDPPLLASNSKTALEAKVTSGVQCAAFKQPNFAAIEGFSQALKGFYELKEKGLVKKIF
jgi:hypothetical protein